MFALSTATCQLSLGLFTRMPVMPSAIVLNKQRLRNKIQKQKYHLAASISQREPLVCSHAINPTQSNPELPELPDVRFSTPLKQADKYGYTRNQANSYEDVKGYLAVGDGKHWSESIPNRTPVNFCDVEAGWVQIWYCRHSFPNVHHTAYVQKKHIISAGEEIEVKNKTTSYTDNKTTSYTDVKIFPYGNYDYHRGDGRHVASVPNGTKAILHSLIDEHALLIIPKNSLTWAGKNEEHKEATKKWVEGLKSQTGSEYFLFANFKHCNKIIPS